MAELVDGSFVFTVLDGENSIYFVRGENPLCIYHYKKLGIYVYASTETVLDKAVKQARFLQGKPQKVETESGDILRIKENGIRDKSEFDSPFLMDFGFTASPYRWKSSYRNYGFQFVEDSEEEVSPYSEFYPYGVRRKLPLSRAWKF